MTVFEIWMIGIGLGSMLLAAGSTAITLLLGRRMLHVKVNQPLLIAEPEKFVSKEEFDEERFGIWKEINALKKTSLELTRELGQARSSIIADMANLKRIQQ